MQLYRWKQKQLNQASPVGPQIDSRLRELELELQRVQRVLDVLKKLRQEVWERGMTMR